MVEAVLPSTEWKATGVAHPSTVGSRQIDVLHEGERPELTECGLIHRPMLRGSGLDPEQWSGLALGCGWSGL